MPSLGDSGEVCVGDGGKVRSPRLGIARDSALVPVPGWKGWKQGDERRLEAHLILAKYAGIDGDVFDQTVLDEETEFAFVIGINACLK